MRRSPAQVAKKGLFRSFLERSSLLKLDHDLVHGYDISVVPYPLRLNLAAWGVVLHPAGRILEVKARDDGLLDLTYQGGLCRSGQDWRCLVEKPAADEQDSIRRFYNQVRVLAGERILLAGTVGFGFWDALWMALDFDRAGEMLRDDPEFVDTVFQHWHGYHLGAASAMLDAGIKLIVVRENPRGFPSTSGMVTRLDAFLGQRFKELSKTVHDRGGCLFLDCDADEIFETDYAYDWGFDGIGPLLFRDEDDLSAARKSLSDQLLLVGTVSYGSSRPREGKPRFPRGLIITNRPDSTAPMIGSEAGKSDRTSPSIIPEDFRLAS
jgi:hypothetical protein